MYLLWELFYHYFSLQPFKCAHRKFRQVHNKDPVTKISSTKFAVFGPAKSQHSFAKISALKVIEVAARMNSFTVIFKVFYQLSRITNDHL